MRPSHKSSKAVSKPLIKLLAESSDSFEPGDLTCSSYRSAGLGTEETGGKDLASLQFTLLYRPATNGNLLQVVRRRQFPPATLQEIGKTTLRTAEIPSHRSLAVEENEETAQPAQIHCKFPYQSSVIPPKRRGKLWIPRLAGTISQPGSPKRVNKRKIPIKVSVSIPVEVAKPSPAPLFVFRRPKRSLPGLEIHHQTRKDLSISPIPHQKSPSLHHFPSSSSHSHPPTRRFLASQDLPLSVHSPNQSLAGCEDDPKQSEARRLVEKAKTLLSLEVSRRHKGAKRLLRPEYAA